ncbi:MAG: ferritin-like domain-containing protein [Actinobacteria bacterium]|nr:ferritin-like domain-containing protein [Actinomycetota bacterium]
MNSRSASDRRALLRAGVGLGVSGAAVSLLPLPIGSAVASSGTDGTTTTAPPRRPTDDDVALLAAAQQIELTARELYDVALAAGGWSEVETTVITTIREAHEAVAQALAGMLGGDAPGEISQPLFESLSGGFEGSLGDRLAAAYSLESAIVATHGAALAALTGIDGATLVAAAQSAEARHGTVLADLAGDTDLATLLVWNEQAELEVSA